MCAVLERLLTEQEVMKHDRDHQTVLQGCDSHAASHTTEDQAGTALELAEPSQGAVNVVVREDIPPDGGYGWICAACVFFINAHTWGINSVGKAVCDELDVMLTLPGVGNIPSTLP